MAGFGLVFPDWEIEKLQSTKKSETLWGKNLFLYFLILVILKGPVYGSAHAH